jgi:hypothetical protein
MTILADEIRELLCRQLHYINSGKVKFLVYRAGANGEYLSIKIPKYSSNNYIEPEWSVNERNRYINNYRLLGQYCLIGDYADMGMKVKDYIDLYINNINSDYLEEIYFFKKIDRHLANGGMFLARAHHFLPEFMNSSNSYYLYADTAEMKSYLINLRNIKLCHGSFNNSHSRLDEHKNSLDPYNLNIIKMSEMFNYGYLENIFNIKGKEFHEELMRYYKRNLLLVSSYT